MADQRREKLVQRTEFIGEADRLSHLQAQLGEMMLRAETDRDTAPSAISKAKQGLKTAARTLEKVAQCLGNLEDCTDSMDTTTRGALAVGEAAMKALPLLQLNHDPRVIDSRPQVMKAIKAKI